MGNSVRFKASIDDQVSGKLTKMRDQFDRLGKSKGAMSILQGVGVGVGISALGALSGAIGSVTQALGDAVHAAAADELSQARLYTAVEENSKAWDGNRDSIEAVIKERMKLAFSDEEQRDSLALLVAKTGDVTEALDIQRTAMDLARLKGIDLADASRAIALGMEGSGRALKELGINVAELTDKHEVLGKVQEKAAGQAEAYADTAAGSMESLEIAVGELAEAVGYELLPYLKDLTKTLTDDVLPNIDEFMSLLGWIPRIINPVGTAMGDASKEAAKLVEEQAKIDFDAMVEGARRESEAWGGYSEAVMAARMMSNKAAKSLGNVQAEANDARRELEELIQTFKDTARAARDNSLDKHYDLSTIDDQIILAKGEVRAARRELEDAQTKEQKAAARIRLANARLELVNLENQARDMRDDFGAAGALLGDALGVKLYNRVVAWNRLTRRELAALGDVGKNKPPKKGNENPDIRAFGGPVTAGKPYWVGEQGPELFVPKFSGDVVPTERLVPTAGGTPVTTQAAPVNLAVYLDSEQIAARVERRQSFAASVAPVSVR